MSSLENQILEEAGREMKLAIEDELGYHFMMKYWQTMGDWTTVKLSRFQDNYHAVDITLWLDEQGLKDEEHYYRDGREFLFRDAETATMFIMRWA